MRLVIQIILLYALFIVGANIHAQKNQKDSLLAVWNQGAKESSIRLSALNDLINLHFADVSSDSSIILASEGITLAKAQNLFYWEATLTNLLGKAEGIKGNYIKALDHHMQAEAIFTRIGDFDGLASTLNNISYIYYIQTDYESSMKNLKKSARINLKLNKLSALAGNYNNIANLYSDGFNDTMRAQRFFQKSLNIFSKIGEINGIGVSQQNLGRIYALKGDYEKALHLLNQSEFNLKACRNLNVLSNTYYDKAMIFANLNEIDSSLKHALLSYNLSHEVNAMHGLLNASKLLHDLYKRRGDVHKSLAFLEEHLTYQKESFNSEIRDELYKSAIRNTFEKKILQDSITYVRDLEQKDAALTSAKKGRILLIVILLITIALLFISVRLYRVHKERGKLIEEENLRLSAEVQKLLEKVSNEGKKLNPDDLGLSKRQMEILELIKQGKTNKEIADELFISVNTVKYHLKMIYEALDIEHRSHAKLL